MSVKPTVQRTCPGPSSLSHDDWKMQRTSKCLTDFYEEFVVQGKPKPQGWDCTSQTRHTGKYAGALTFIYHSPIGTSYRSRTEAWRACGLEVTSKRKAEAVVKDTAAKLPAELTQKPQAQGNAVFPRQSNPDRAQAPADSDADDVPAEHVQSKPAQNCIESHGNAGPAKRSRPATKAEKPAHICNDGHVTTSPFLVHPDSVPLASVTEQELAARNLAKVRIKCKGKHGVFHAAQLRVECVDVCCTSCTGKTGVDRMMLCSGRFSFEEHCGKAARQHTWRQSFKVQSIGSEGKALDKHFAAHKIDLYGKSAPALQQAATSPGTSTQPKASSQAKPYASPQANSPQAKPHASPEAEPYPRSALPTPAGPTAAVSTVQALHSSRQRSEQSHGDGEQHAQPRGSRSLEEVLRLAELSAAECVKAEPDSDLECSTGGSVPEAELDSDFQPEAPATSSAPTVMREAYFAPSRATEPSQTLTARTGTQAEAPQRQSESCAEPSGPAEHQEEQPGMTGHAAAKPAAEPTSVVPQTTPTRGGPGSRVLKQDEKSVRRRLRRQLTAKDKKLAEAHAQIASLQQLHIASQAETDKLRIQLNQLKDAADDTADAEVHTTDAQQTDATVDKARIVELQQQLQVATEEAGEQQSRAAAISQQMQQDMQLAKDDSQLQQEKAAAMYQELQQQMQGQITKLQLDNYHLKLQGRV